jgi:hypothetical protein
MIGKSHVVVVGRLVEGNYTFVDLRKEEITTGTEDATARVT